MKRTGSSNIASRSSLVKLGNRSRSTVPSSLNRRMSSQLPPNSTRERPGARILQHPPRLRRDHSRLVEIAGRRVRQQFLVRQARPQEITEAAGQRVVRQRTVDVAEPAARPRVLRGACAPSRACVDDESIEEVRRHQDADDVTRASPFRGRGRPSGTRAVVSAADRRVSLGDERASIRAPGELRPAHRGASARRRGVSSRPIASRSLIHRNSRGWRRGPSLRRPSRGHQVRAFDAP